MRGKWFLTLVEITYIVAGMKNKMKLIKKLTILSIIMGLGILPSLAKIDGEVSRNCFYDTDKTLMTEIFPNKTLKTGKYWEKNLFYFSNKYRPLFMLSNKELYNLMPKEHVSVVRRITTPSVYNVSLKTASIKTISLNPAPSVPVLKKSAEVPKFVNKINKLDTALFSQYEEAKNPQTEPEKKMETALSLKESKNISNYRLAIDLLDDVTRQEPYNAYAFYLKGELFAECKSPENAMKNYIEALRLNPASKQSCLGIAKILEPTNKQLAQKYYDLARVSEKQDL